MASLFNTDFEAAAAQIEELFAEEITHYPAGDIDAPEPIDAIVDRDAEDAGGVGAGEGNQFDRRESVKLRRNATLEIADTVSVSEDSGRTTAPSLFEFDSKRWRAVRILARHSGKVKVLVTRLDKLATRRVERP